MSSRAVNPELLRALYNYNHHPDRWAIRSYAPHVGARALDDWGGGRTRRALQCAYLLAFWCLLRFDEVLNIQFQDICFVAPTCISLTLRRRKNAQYGGE
jgi:hypothetical protein